MKRLIAFILIIIASFLLLLTKNNNKVFDYDYEKVIIVTKNEKLLDDCEKMVNGNNIYFLVRRDQGDKIKNLDFSYVSGIVLYLNKDIKFDYFNRHFNFTLFGGKTIENRQVFYGYDKNYGDYRIIKNKKVNVQLAKTENEWILGYPLIITGF